MRIPTVVTGGLCICLSASALAESPAELQAKGEELAKQGHFTEAIDAFKAADKVEPTATHACLIALAYTRRELWPQAEIWLAQCQVRASAKDPLPEWAPAEQDQINERLAAANVAPVELDVVPVDAGAKLTVSSFAPDEQFSPRTIHLPPGLHTIRATAPGYQDAEQQIEIKDKTPRKVVIKLEKPGSGTPLPPGPGAASTMSSQSKVPWLVIGAGGTLALVGASLHVFYYRPKYDVLNKASADNNPTAYNQALPAWRTAREVTLGVYGAAALTLGVGVILKYTVYKDHERAPAVGFVPVAGGGVMSLELSR
ncbi:MAG: PEGA domain-containing protein [Acidobacteriota bacterium]